MYNFFLHFFIQNTATSLYFNSSLCVVDSIKKSTLFHHSALKSGKKVPILNFGKLYLVMDRIHARNWIFHVPEISWKMGLKDKLNKDFLHFLRVFLVYLMIFKVSSAPKMRYFLNLVQFAF